jgi:hypothetical protein
MAREFDEYRGTALWKAVEATLAELVATSEVRIDTAPDYVIGYLCRELAAKRVVVSEAVQRTS